MFPKGKGSSICRRFLLSWFPLTWWSEGTEFCQHLRDLGGRAHPRQGPGWECSPATASFAPRLPTVLTYRHRGNRQALLQPPRGWPSAAELQDLTFAEAFLSRARGFQSRPCPAQGGWGSCRHLCDYTRPRSTPLGLGHAFHDKSAGLITHISPSCSWHCSSLPLLICSVLLKVPW